MSPVSPGLMTTPYPSRENNRCVSVNLCECLCVCLPGCLSVFPVVCLLVYEIIPSVDRTFPELHNVTCYVLHNINQALASTSTDGDKIVLTYNDNACYEFAEGVSIL